MKYVDSDVYNHDKIDRRTLHMHRSHCMMTQSAKMRGAIIILYFVGMNNYLHYTLLLIKKQRNIYNINIFSYYHIRQIHDLLCIIILK